MDIAAILTVRYVGAEWTLDGEDYAGLTWLSDSPKPTEQELLSLWSQVQYEMEFSRVERARARAYREKADPVFFEFQRGDATEAEWLAAVQAVRDAHPYPEAP